MGGLAWALSTGPITPPTDAETGAAESMGPNFLVATGSASAPPPAEGKEADKEVNEHGGANIEDAQAAGAQPSAGAEGEGGGSASGEQPPDQGAVKPSNPKPSHTHSWSAVYRTEPVYSQQWVSKWEDVFVKVQERYRCTTCGATYYSLSEMNAHLDSTIDWDSMTGHAGYLDDSYEVWEKRDNRSYQNVQTGTRQVLDHYECPCGARK